MSYSNLDLDFEDDAVFVRTEIKAYCTSDACLKDCKEIIKTGTFGKAVLKYSPKTESFCKDCDHALFWE